MALTRKFLSALGITGDTQDEVINAHVEQMDEIKAERDTYKADAEKLATVQKQLDDANKKLAKQGEGETILKSEYDDLKNQFETYKNEIETEKEYNAKQTAYVDLIKANNVSSKRIDAILKCSKDIINDIKLDKDGKITDADKYSENIKTEWADFIETSNIDGAGTPTPPQTTTDTDLGSLSMEDYIKARTKGN